MSAQSPSYQDLVDLIDLIKSSSSFTEVRLRSGDLEIELRRGPASVPVPDAPSTASVSPPRVVASAAPAPTARSGTVAEGHVVIKSPMVGTFYRSPEPDAAPFVEVGQEVTPDTTVCIIEVMKLMSTIKAEQAGTVVEILVDDAHPVEYGQALIVIKPH